MGMLVINCDTDKASDGCHTFGELYHHRQLLYVALMKSHPKMSWRSLRHEDGSAHDGWFVAGMRTPKGDISYHLKEEFWFMLHGIATPEKAPPFDGHTSKNVLERIEDWVVEGSW